MKYTVVKLFMDLQDGNHTYHVGDVYPRKGVKPTKKRIKELSTAENRQRVPLIELAEQENNTETEEG